MSYPKSLAINFLCAFFANHILPGLEITSYARLPHLGGDLLFAFILGLLNSLIFFGFKVFHQEISAVKIAMVSFGLNFLSYGVVKFLPFGVHVETIEGYILVVLIVGMCSFLTNFFEMKRRAPLPPEIH